MQFGRNYENARLYQLCNILFILFIPATKAKTRMQKLACHWCKLFNILKID